MGFLAAQHGRRCRFGCIIHAIAIGCNREPPRARTATPRPLDHRLPSGACCRCRHLHRGEKTDVQSDPDNRRGYRREPRPDRPRAGPRAPEIRGAADERHRGGFARRARPDIHRGRRPRVYRRRGDRAGQSTRSQPAPRSSSPATTQRSSCRSRKRSHPGPTRSSWHALSTDGHKTKGSYAFTIKP